MATEMGRIRETANAHMRRDVAESRTWSCTCESCREWRSLVGLEKMLEVRNLVRDLADLETQMQNAPDSPELQTLKQRYLALHDELAAKMAK